MKSWPFDWVQPLSNTLEEVRAVLDAAGYRTLMPQPTVPSLYFEDLSVLGVVYVVDTVQQLLSGWEHLQDSFLRDNASRLVVDPFKAWNCYSVFLTDEQPAKNDASALFSIEEDFRGTRKIVRAGVSTRHDIERALAPLLPLRRLLTLAPDDIKARLASRLGVPGAPLQGLLLDTKVEQVAASLLEAE